MSQCKDIWLFCKFYDSGKYSISGSIFQVFGNYHFINIIEYVSAVWLHRSSHYDMEIGEGNIQYMDEYFIINRTKKGQIWWAPESTCMSIIHWLRGKSLSCFVLLYVSSFNPKLWVRSIGIQITGSAEINIHIFIRNGILVFEINTKYWVLFQRYFPHFAYYISWTDAREFTWIMILSVNPTIPT